jgi:hypothetical protein
MIELVCLVVAYWLASPVIDRLEARVAIWLGLTPRQWFWAVTIPLSILIFQPWRWVK